MNGARIESIWRIERTSICAPSVQALSRIDQEAIVESDLEYYRRRLGEERDCAAKADRPDVRIVHEKLAAMYKARIKELRNESQPREMVPSQPAMG